HPHGSGPSLLQNYFRTELLNACMLLRQPPHCLPGCLPVRVHYTFSVVLWPDIHASSWAKNFAKFKAKKVQQGTFFSQLYPGFCFNTGFSKIAALGIGKIR